MNLVKWLREALTPDAPESRYRIKFAHGSGEVRAQVYEKNSWHTIKAVGALVDREIAIERCKAAIEQYKNLNVDENGVINL